MILPFSINEFMYGTKKKDDKGAPDTGKVNIGDTDEKL